MAKYTLTYPCGHTAIAQRYGTHTERENAIAYAERSKRCPDCYKEAHTKLHAEESTRYADANAAYGTLTGTEKQGSWAVTLRGKLMADINSMAIKDAEGVAHVHAAIARQQDSRWWIEQRHNLDNAITGMQTFVAQDERLRSYMEQRRTP